MLSLEKSFTDISESVGELVRVKQVTLRTTTLPINKSGMPSTALGNKFVVVDGESIENNDDNLSNEDWNLILNSKNHRVLFQQNLFTIKNHIIKRGTNAQK